MHPVLLIDFGSTCTKLTAVNVEWREILATAEDFTTAAEDISIGLNRALAKIENRIGKVDYRARLACSSAAGGLRMVACGLVPELTAKAARFAAYGAGAKVIKTYAYELTEEDAKEISHRARHLAAGGRHGWKQRGGGPQRGLIAGIGGFPVVYAGNRAAKCGEILGASSHPVSFASNVMPTFGKIDVVPVQQVIREIFLQRIIQFKGLSSFRDVLDGILMPARGAQRADPAQRRHQGRQGLGELMALDLGGATTDVYSIASGAPTNPGTFLHGLREPFVKRTVEGDIGMRYSAHGIVEAAGMEELLNISGLSQEQAEDILARIRANPSMLPETEDERAMDFALAALALRLGMVRHAGSLQQVYTPVGPIYQQTGKDLTGISRIIMTGGALIHHERFVDIARTAVSVQDPASLIPRRFSLIRDRRYILSAMGLLADYDKEAAFDLLYQHFGKEEDYATCQ